MLYRLTIPLLAIACAAALLVTAPSGFSQQAAVSGPDYFTARVYPVLEKAGCQGCHSPDGVASPTRLHFPEPGAPDKQLRTFGLSLAALVDRAAPAKSPLLTKPTRRIAHAGGKRIDPESPDDAVLTAWVEYLAKHAPAADRVIAHHEEASARKPVLRRLTHQQYNNTIRDLLGDDSRLADQFPPEDFVNGFKNQYQSQSISPLLAEAYTHAAEKLAQSAFRGGDNRGLIPCKPASPNDADCRDRLIRTFGRKAFRRPLLDAEISRYAKLFTREAASHNDFLAGARIVIEGMLQSPSFLLRTEDGANPDWRPYETASRLSYFYWDTMPNDWLFEAAEKGKLNTPEGLEAVARRMLDDPRARESLDEFVNQWLRFDRLLSAVKDRRSFPQYTLELSVAMTEESRRLVSELVWKDGNFMEFYSADYSYLSSDLAKLYGVPAPAEEYGKVKLPPETQRAGVLGQALFLALTSKPADTSPTARGLFVREQFLCQEVPQPPPGVSTSLPPLSEAKPQTNRDRLGVHLSNESCASCHSLIDPIGFGMEKFDAIGQYREKLKLNFGPRRSEPDKQSFSVELDLDTSGDIAGIPNSRFSSPRELGKILAGAEQCQECVVKQLFRYASGRRETPADRPVIRASFDAFRHSQFRFKELMVALMKNTVFPPGRNEADARSHH